MTLQSKFNELGIIPELQYIIYDFASYKNTYNSVLQELTFYNNGQIQWITARRPCMYYLDANRDEITSKQVMYHLAMLDEMEPMFSYLSHENYNVADVYDQYILDREALAGFLEEVVDPFCSENLHG